MAQPGGPDDGDRGLPDPPADEAAWARLSHRQKVERRARRRALVGGSGASARDAVIPEPDPTGRADPRTGPDPLLAAMPDNEVYGTFPNREAASAAVRSFEGAAPVLVLVVPVWVVLLALWWLSPSLVPLVLMMVLTVAFVAIAAYGYRQIRARTPSSLSVGSDALFAQWGPHRDLTIPFDRLRSADGRKWRWTQGKGAYAMYFPPSVYFSQLPPGTEVPSGSLPPPEGILYLTDQNLLRVRAAWQRWDMVPGADADAPLLSGGPGRAPA
jgi:hypothetical protein